jgi:hypothetical protein
MHMGNIVDVVSDVWYLIRDTAIMQNENLMSFICLSNSSSWFFQVSS